jgi:hypothetical protein
MSNIEGKAARVAASECGQRARFNEANGMSNIEGSELATGRVRPIGGPDWQFSCKDGSERLGSGASFKVETQFGIAVCGSR